MRPYLLVLAVSLALVGVIYGTRIRNRPPVASNSAVADALRSDVPAFGSVVSLQSALKQMTNKKNLKVDATYSGGRQDVKATVARSYSKAESVRAEKYFERILKDPGAKVLYKKAQGLMGASKEGDGAARWITLGGVFSSSDGYGDSLHIALKDANANPGYVLAQLKSGAEQLRRDPFLYQMAMNLNYQLDLDANQRGEFFGQEMEHQLKALSSQPTDAFWVALMGLTLAKQAGVGADVLRSYVDRGISESNGDPKTLTEFKKTVAFHFPEMRVE